MWLDRVALGSLERVRLSGRVSGWSFIQRSSHRGISNLLEGPFFAMRLDSTKKLGRRARESMVRTSELPVTGLG